ncbi:hypothetical protein [Streptomyces sp. NPDC004250]|uniref:hypothetical protein n=1 Tax=Streptomyces sp. NPDC004250 TaxID=3364692 RepID=UPI00369298DC
MREDLVPVTDEERARRVREFYGLDRSNPIIAPGYLPAAPRQGVSRFERSMRQRLHDLARPASGVKAGEFEAAALRAAGLPLKKRENGGGYNIDRASALLESAARADDRDLDHAAKVRTFYGLDGSTPIMKRGHLPSPHAPQGASEFEKSMRQRLYNLTVPANGSRAGEFEAAALREAGLPLKPRANGDGYKIDKASALLESAARTDDRDLDHAAKVRTFYGLDGSTPIMMPGYLPSPHAPQGASDFEKSIRKRLHHLTDPVSRSRAEEFEAAALREAGLPLKPRANGDGYLIDKASALLESAVRADDRDLGYAAKVRTFYGLDRNTPIVQPGHLPSQHAPQGASDFEKSMRKRLYKLTVPASTSRAGEFEAAALREAGLPLKPRENGDGYKIDREATVQGSRTGFAAAPVTRQPVQTHTPTPAWSASAAYTQPIPSGPGPDWNRETPTGLDLPSAEEMVEASKTFFPELSGMTDWTASPHPQQLSNAGAASTVPYTPSYYAPPANPTRPAAAHAYAPPANPTSLPATHTYQPTSNPYRTDQGSTRTSNQTRPPQPQHQQQARPSRRAR